MGYSVGMNAVTLSELGPVIAAVLGPMLAFVVVSMRYQHLDGVKTREMIADSNKEMRDLNKETRDLISESEKETRDLISESSREMRDLNKETREELAEHRRETRQGFGELGASLGDARERLARIEGHLGIGAPRPQDEASDGRADAA